MAKTIVITGGAGGMGKEIAKNVSREGNRVIIGDVNEAAMAAAKAEIAEASGNDDIIALPLNLASLDSVRAFAAAVEGLGAIDALLCNAGVSSTVGTTSDGLDMVFQINYLGHFLLVGQLLKDKALADDARIVLVSSDMHTGLFAPLEYRPAAGVAKPDEEFAQSPDRYNFSKLYLLYLDYYLARGLKAAGSSITINAFNPGLMHTTGLMPDKSQFNDEFLATIKAMGRLGNLEENAKTVHLLLTDDVVAGQSGNYYDRSTEPAKSSDLSYVEEYQQELWDFSLALTGLAAEDFSI